MGIYRSLATLSRTCPIVTTISEIQIVENAKISLEAHDTPLDWIITPERAIKSQNTLPQPGPIDWKLMQEDQFLKIPFLRRLREELSRK